MIALNLYFSVLLIVGSTNDESVTIHQLFLNDTKSYKVKSLNKSILLVLKPYSEYILISPIAILEAFKNIK